MPEIKEELEGKNVDEIYDAVYKDGETSTPEKEASEESEDSETPSEKGETSKDESVNPSQAIEEKLKKISELLGDDEEAIEAYIKKHGYHKDPAWVRQRELLNKYKTKDAISDEDKQVIESVKKLTSSPEGIRLLMKHEGYTDEAINSRLKELGHSVSEKTDTLESHLLKELEKDLSYLPQNERQEAEASIRSLTPLIEKGFKYLYNQMLPNEMKPIKDELQHITRERKANEYSSKMESSVKAEGVLDYEKDIAPKIVEFIEKNPNAKQEEVFDYFEDINHKLVIERLKTGKRKEERDETKTNLRPMRRTTPTGVDLSKIKPVSDGSQNDVSKDLDRLMDELGFE